MGASLKPCGLACVLTWEPRTFVALARGTLGAWFVSTVDDGPQQTPLSSFYQKYTLTGKVGKGSFATVYSVSNAQQPEEDLVAKVVELAKSDLNKEIHILLKVSRVKYCVGLVEYFLEGDFGYILMERCDTEFYDLLCSEANLNERSFVPFASNMFAALVALHDAHIIHRDVKFDNFLFDSRSRMLKLCDFGMSEVVTPEEPFAKGLRGTTPFMSPEMLMREPYGVQTDTWSIGVMMYAILLGQFPYMPRRSNSVTMASMIITNSPAPSFQPASEIESPSVASIDLLHTLIVRDPSTRAKAKEALNHGWFDVSETSEHSSHTMTRAIASARRAGAFSLRLVNDKEGIDDRLMTLQWASRGSRTFLSPLKWTKHMSLASTGTASEWSEFDDRSPM